MRTFAFACLVAVTLARRSRHTEPVTPTVEPVKEEVVDVIPQAPKEQEPRAQPAKPVEPTKPAQPERKKDMYEKIGGLDFYLKHLWMGCYQGLYGMGHSEDRPTDECFGEWIPEKMKEVSTFYHDLKSNFWTVTYEESMATAYNQIDLLFLNDEYCHFRQTWWDVRAFCHQEGNCVMKDVLTNLQTNAFSLITQVSQAVAVFKQQKWSDMDAEDRGYALTQLGHSTTQVFTDLFNFDVRKIPENPWDIDVTEATL